MTPILQLQNVSHIYGANTPFMRRALDGIDMEIYPGEFVGLIGHTGSGKSTLIAHLNGLLKPVEGTVCFNGQDIWERPKEIGALRHKVGLVFQYPEYQLFEETVGKDIAFGPRNMKLSDEDIQAAVRDALDFVGLPSDIAEKSPFDLSGGQKRRVAIAGVMAMRPEVLILDEPTAGLDPAGRDEILGHIRKYHSQSGAAILYVSHSMEEVARLADRVVVLDHARVSRVGTPREIFRDPAALESIGLAVPVITALAARLHTLGLPVDPASLSVSEVCDALLRARTERSRHDT